VAVALMPVPGSKKEVRSGGGADRRRAGSSDGKPMMEKHGRDVDGVGEDARDRGKARRARGRWWCRRRQTAG
jgi:hypothetical protein